MILTKLPLVLWACVIVVLGTSSAYQFANLLDTSREIESIKDVTIQMLTCRRHEKDFINRNDKQYVEKHRQAFEKLRLASHELGELGTTSELTKGLLRYKAHFANIVYATEEIGLTENDGLRGSLRSADSRGRGSTAECRQRGF